MFLNEVALGAPKIIRQDDHTLKAAPKGFDSVLAQGRQEPGTIYVISDNNPSNC